MAIAERYVSALAAGGGDGLTGDTAWTWAEMLADIEAGNGASRRYNVKADATYSRADNDAITVGGARSQPCIVRGYKTAIGDGNLGRSPVGGGPLVTTNMPVVTYASAQNLTVTGAYLVFESLNIGGSTGDRLVALGSGGTYDSFVNCNVVNSSTGNNARVVQQTSTTTGHCIFADCDFESVNSGQIYGVLDLQGASNRILNCRIKRHTGASSSQGIRFSAGSATLIAYCVFTECSGVGVLLADAAPQNIIGCTFYKQGTCVAFPNALRAEPLLLANVMMTDSGKGVDGTHASANHLLSLYGRRRNNTGADTNLGDSLYYNQVTTDLGTDYLDAANGDLRLLQTSPAAGAGWFRYRDIGACQRVGDTPQPHDVRSGRLYGFNTQLGTSKQAQYQPYLVDLGVFV